MDMQTPDHAPATPDGPGGPPSRRFTTRLLKTLAATIPDADPEDCEAAQELLASLNPRDPAEAQFAAIAVAAAQAAMNNFARAARPGMSDDQVMRLRSNGLAAWRAYTAALRYFRKPQAVAPPAAEPARPKARSAAPPTPQPAEPAEQPAATPPGFIRLQPGATPIPDVFRPRDRFGNEIPSWRRDLMSPAQAAAAFSYPPDPAQKAAAIAEEEAMITEQKALESCEAEKQRAAPSQASTVDRK